MATWLPHLFSFCVNEVARPETSRINMNIYMQLFGIGQQTRETYLHKETAEGQLNCSVF